MAAEFPEPTAPRDSRAETLLGYLDFFRARVAEKIAELPVAEATGSQLPSAWTPVELAWHLRCMERRWLVWGFLGEAVADPWADHVDDRWSVPDGTSVAGVLDALHAQGERTREVVAAHELDEIGAPGPRWDGAAPASLERVLLHVLQEYARHLGQLDVVVELAGGPTGE